MNNPLRKFNLLQQRRRQRESIQTLQLWVWLEKLFESGQFSFDYENHRLFITQPMAVLMMAHGADGWVQAVHNIYEFARWMQVRHAWEQFMQKEELAAVRKAIATISDSSASELTPADIERIKHAKRQEIAMSDMEMPKAEPFEFFIIPLSTAAKVEPIGVGYYDPNTGQMDVATWDEVKSLLQAPQK